MKTVVLQSFRTTGVPDWMQRCLESVRAWARERGYEYDFLDDRLFAYCGDNYLRRVGDYKCAITDLARLEWTKAKLEGGYDRAIWLDADVFVFAPRRYAIELTSGYAFGKEVWLRHTPEGQLVAQVTAHNALSVFTREQSDLDFLIAAIRHIATTRRIHSNFQVGVWLITGLWRSLNFPLLANTGNFSPTVLNALLGIQPEILAELARLTGAEIHAANLCWSKIASESEVAITEAMDRLKEGAGQVINRYAPKPDRMHPSDTARAALRVPGM